MIDFCPDGYLTTVKAIAAAALRWFADQFTALEKAAPSQPATELESPLERAVRVFSQPPIPDEWRQAFEELNYKAVHRMRNLLHEGKLHGYYFDKDGRHKISREFWATAEADGVLESGVYWPFGRPSRPYEQRTNYALFLLQSELDTLLSAERAKKRALPRSRISDLVAALRELAGMPTRQAQYDALRELAQFEKFKITRADFREAARHVPRGRGRKSRQETRQE